MIRVLAYTLQALTVVFLSRKIFLALRSPDYLGLASNGILGADIATILQVEYTGLCQLINETRSFPAVSRDLTIGSFGVEDLATVIRHSSLDGGAVLADSLQVFWVDARKTAQHLRVFQLKVYGLTDRVFSISSIILQTLETVNLTSHELAACNIIQLVAASPPRCQAVLRLPTTFQTFLDTLELGVESLIVRAIELETSLSSLYERLDTMRDVTAEEAKVYLSEKDQILASFWTQFGANRQQIFLLNHNLQVLGMIQEHRRFTDSCISNIGSELQTMKASLEHLRPLSSSFLQYGVGSPVGLIVQQIKVGAERLNHQTTRGLDLP